MLFLCLQPFLSYAAFQYFEKQNGSISCQNRNDFSFVSLRKQKEIMKELEEGKN